MVTHNIPELATTSTFGPSKNPVITILFADDEGKTSTNLHFLELCLVCRLIGQVGTGTSLTVQHIVSCRVNRSWPRETICKFELRCGTHPTPTLWTIISNTIAACRTGRH